MRSSTASRRQPGNRTGQPGKWFNHAVGASGDVGIWHETYKVHAGEYECVYVNMPRSRLAAAGVHAPDWLDGQSAARRIGATDVDEPALTPTSIRMAAHPTMRNGDTPSITGTARLPHVARRPVTAYLIGEKTMCESTFTDPHIPDSLPSILTPAAAKRGASLRVLFLVSAHNGLSQRAWIALREQGHQVEVAVVDSAAAMEAAVRANDPELIVCPFLKTMIPETVWRRHQCLVVHPGPLGDRGPSSLDWAIELSAAEWGVTVLLANGEFDAGEPVATRGFRMRQAGKASVYRHEVRHAATEALLDAAAQIARRPRPR